MPLNLKPIEPRIVFCPDCENQPMAIKSVAPAVLLAAGSIQYFCVKCGHETITPVPL